MSLETLVTALKETARPSTTWIPTGLMRAQMGISMSSRRMVLLLTRIGTSAVILTRTTPFYQP